LRLAPGGLVTAAVRAVLFGAGIVAIGLVRYPTAAGATLGPGLTWSTEAQLFEARPTDASLRVARDEGPADVADIDEESLESPGSEAPAAVAGSRDYRWTAADVIYMRDHASPRARCIIDREVGGFDYDPWRRGSQGERGPVQLHPRGLLPDYLLWSGGQAPENPYYAVPYLEYKLRQGQGRHWSPVRLGLC
jgi:hypothetical protein